MTLDAIQIENLLPQYLYPGFRISGLVMSMPIIGTHMVPARTKIILVVALTLLIGGMVPKATVPMLSLDGMIVAVNQLLIGITVGLVLHIIFQAFIMCGQLVAQQMGLGFASMMDPSSGVSVPSLGQLYSLLVMLIFLSIDGHLIVIHALVESFHTIPIGVESIQFPQDQALVYWGGWIFSGALQIALPAITALFLVNMSFGVMTKAAPQLNIFTIGFPATMLVGLLIVYLSLISFDVCFHSILNDTNDLIFQLLGLNHER